MVVEKFSFPSLLRIFAMDLASAEKLAVRLMHKHKVNFNFTFSFNRRKVWMGTCYYPHQGKSGRICLSKDFVILNDVLIVKDTILHEVAHAKTWLLYGESGHGILWKQIAAAIGARPSRCVSDAAIIPRKRYRATCQQCGTNHTRQRMGRDRFGKTLAYQCTYCKNKAPALVWVDREAY